MFPLPPTGTIYFLGIGGIGMSALARYFLSQGWRVSGYDKTPTSLTRTLEQEGMEIHYTEDITRIPDHVDLVVYTPAVPTGHAEYRHFIGQNTPVLKRAQLLGIISQGYKTLAIAGTHGKTTTSTMAAHLLYQSGTGCQAFLGGISKNYESNLLLSAGSEYLVAEADEFDRSFLFLHPAIAVITSVDADHLDIYGDHQSLLESFRQFTGNLVPNGILLLKKGLPLAVPSQGQFTCYHYSLEEKADFYADSLSIIDGLYRFDFHYPGGIMKEMVLGLPGHYNVENAVAALAVAWLCGAKEKELGSALRSFSGVRRRFDIRIKRDDLVYIDDYAHHPAELTASITAARNLYKGRRITGIFQPHLFTRTRDFADEFARSLELLDEIILLPIYPAREIPIPGVTSEMLLGKIHKADKKLLLMADLPDMLDPTGLEVLMTLGAGDIDTLAEPIESYLTRNKSVKP